MLSTGPACGGGCSWPGGRRLTAALGLTWLVSRSITRPLQSLTAQAKHLAGDQLARAVTEVLATPLVRTSPCPSSSR